jgi:hypothetical protein
MPHTILCPHCRQQVSVPENLVGQTVRCPRCQATFVATVGDQGQQAGPEPAPTTDFQAEPVATGPSGAPGQSEPAAESAPRTDRPRFERAQLAPHRGAVILVLGILSIVLGCVGLILGPIAWIMGSGDLNEMRLGRMDPEGEGLTNAGRICGIIGTFVNLAGCCCGGVWLFPFGPGRHFRLRL